MANTMNAFGLLLEDFAPQSDASRKRTKKKKKSKSILSGLKEDTVTSSPPSTSKVAVAGAEDEQEGFRTVGKGSRAKGLVSAKSLEHLPKESAQLATQARQEAETQASSPYIQGTVESWTKKVQGVQTSSYLEASGKALSWKEVLLSSRALETLISTCLAEKVDTSLEPMLAALFTHIAARETAEKRTLAEGLAAAVVMLAHAIDRKLPQNVAAAESALKQLLALLQAPEEGKPPQQAALANGASAEQVESRMTEKAAQLKAAKPGKQAELWAQLSELWQQVSSAGHSYAHTSEPAAVTTLRRFEAALESFKQDPVAQRNAAAAEGEKLTSQRAAIQKKLQDALAVVDSLRCELAAVEQDIMAHLSRQEQPVQQISLESLSQQLAIVQQLAGQLGSSEPVAVPRQPAISSETRAAFGEAAGSVLCSQLGLQREVATKAFHANERCSRKRQQVEQLAGFGESKDHKTAASQLEVIEREIKKYEKDSAEIRDFAKSVALAAAGAGVPPHVVSEHAELIDACMQQHAKLLDGPLRLQGARMEVLVQDVRAPLIGNAVATSGLQQPISRPIASPIAPPPPDSSVSQPSFSPVTAGAYSQWNSAASPSQPVWYRHQSPNFGELLQGSSVSEAPSKTPAPIAPASFHSAVETPRGVAPTLVSVQSPSGQPIESLQDDAALPQALSSTAAQLGVDGLANGGGHSGVAKPKRNRSRNRQKPAPA